MKKILSICLSIVMLLSIVATGVVNASGDIPAFDESKPYIKATSEPVKAGEIAKVTFIIGNNPKFWGINQSYKFDTSVLSFVTGETNEYGTFPKYDKGASFPNSLISPINDKGEFTIVYTEIYNDTEIKSNSANGEIFSIYLKVAEDAAPGSYLIEMIDYSSENYLSVSGKPVAFTFNQPKVEVYDPEATTTTTTTTTTTEPTTITTTVGDNDPSETDPWETTTTTTAEPTEPSSSETEPTEPSSSETTKPSVQPTQSTTEPTVKPTESTTVPTQSTTQPTVKPDEPIVCVHTTVIKNFKKATYFGAGYSGDTVCVKCGETTAKGVVLAQLKLKTPKFKVTKGKKQFKVKYTKVKDANKFQVRYRIKGKWKMKTFKAKKNITKTIKKLKKGKYKVQVRAMIVNGKLKAYSKWAKAKKVTVK